MPQWTLTRMGRSGRGPMPSRQWYVIREAAAGPAQHGDFQRPQRGDHVVPQAVRVGEDAVWADPDAGVDEFAEVFGEVSVQVGIDGPDGFLGQNEKALCRVHVAPVRQVMLAMLEGII